MSVLQSAGDSSISEGRAYDTVRSEQTAYMSDNAPVSEKRTHVSGLTAHEDARALVRLIQCPLCSRPFRSPVTLPCGNTLCRECLPETFQRENITYPDLPGRRQAIRCPFAECEKEHPKTDCNIDVTMTKVMDSIGEIVAKQISLAGSATTVVEETVRWDECISSQPVSEKARAQSYPGGRLLATYLFAANGDLYRATDVTYPDEQGEAEQAVDVAIMQELHEATHKEVDCQVCYNVYLDPVTTFCGHTLCRTCLARTLDHSSYCPTCRRGLLVQPSLQDQPSNKTLSALLLGLCPEAIAARAETVAMEDLAGEGELSTPLFICTLAFPHMPTFLRIFEPRYRLMLRRCLEGNREFGMLMYNRYNEPQGELGNVHFYQYGTMLRIIHAQLMPDGTSVVESRGIYRFRVRAHGTHDGYAVGNVERVEDLPLDEEERIEAIETSRPILPTDEPGADLERMSTQDLLALGHDFINRMRNRSAIWLQQRVLNTHGQPPNDAALFPFWFASVLPISDSEKYKLLGTTTVRERLKITSGWIRRIESQRWYQSNACAIL
ncbi:hypothetical protein AMS68_000910 [Peltaster fructicola]|uniref:RING-type domain-containing protein n=1 Tax=Peltaster fructicola TaxID=286661 RepID=A0A6H0XKZ7_9PEZI|nr:hypothetical protein AMS68_000910 [Peltaster fructicola]